MMNLRNDLGRRGAPGLPGLATGLAIALLALAMLATAARAQDSAAGDPGTVDVVGTVVDAETGQLLVAAWVGFSGSDWGSITNDEGRFRLSDVDQGPLSLTVELLGYEKLEWVGDVPEDVAALQIELSPRPVMLQGLTVMLDRFETRRRAVATTVRAYEAEDLATSGQITALDFVTLRAGTGLAQRCNGSRGNLCLWVRGRLVEPTVYIDEFPVVAGLEYLQSFAPHELYMVEIYGNGRHIRAYTPRFMERIALRPITPIG